MKRDFVRETPARRERDRFIEVHRLNSAAHPGFRLHLLSDRALVAWVRFCAGEVERQADESERTYWLLQLCDAQIHFNARVGAGSGLVEARDDCAALGTC